jgi:hypothetical protein
MALPSILSQIYSTLFLLALISLNIWLSVGKILSFYGQIPLPTAILDALGFFFLAAICILNCLFEDFLYRHKLSVVRSSLNKTANFLGFTNRNNKQTIVKVLTYLATFVAFGFNIFTNKNALGSNVFKYNLVGLFLTYRIFLLVLCVYDAANAIQNRFVVLSQKIQKLVQFCNTQNYDKALQAVDCFKCYFTLVESMDNVSQIYGWQILATYKMIVLLMVATIYYVYQLLDMGLSHVMFMLSNVLTTTLLIVIV